MFCADSWNDYGRDFGVNTLKSILTDVVKQVHSRGGNIVRLWLHCDAAATPLWTGTSTSDTVTRLPSSFIPQLKAYLDVAQKEGVFVLLSLFDFLIVRNHGSLYYDKKVRQSYIDNALTPLVTQLKSYPNVLWEIFNEPEGVTPEHQGWQYPQVGG